MNALKQLLLPFGHSINELRNVKYGDNFVWHWIIDGSMLLTNCSVQHYLPDSRVSTNESVSAEGLHLICTLLLHGNSNQNSEKNLFCFFLFFLFFTFNLCIAQWEERTKMLTGIFIYLFLDWLTNGFTKYTMVHGSF